MDEQKQTIDEAKEPSIEEIFEELDTILAAMDEGEVSLDDAFALYEKGMKKVRQANERLDLVEKKMLEIASDGSEQPFDE